MSKPFAGIPTDEQPEEPRKLTPSMMRHEELMAAIQRSPSPAEHTVDISRNAKGAYQWAIAVRGSNLDEVVQLAREKATELAAAFPYEAEPASDTDRAARAAAAIARTQASRS
jgi:hypothetical protein